MKKIEQAASFITQNLSLFQCPVCRQDFHQFHNNSLNCLNGHSFNLSKKGTIHFLQKQSKNDYSREMLLHRHLIAQAGLFDHIIQSIYQLIENKEGATLDVGCGEGSHLSALAKMGLAGQRIGFDISKEGIQLAASHYRDAFWCVADLSRSPFAENQYDTILNIFSPSNYKEFHRLLKPGGQVIKVVPGENYLIELREQFYKDRQEKQRYSNQEVVDHFAQHFPNYTTQEVHYSFDVPEDRVDDLMKMTPLYWSANKEETTSLLKQGINKVTVDVQILVGKCS